MRKTASIGFPIGTSEGVNGSYSSYYMAFCQEVVELMSLDSSTDKKNEENC